MTILHSGSTKKFAAGWDAVFSGKKTPKKAASRKKAPAAKKTAKKSRKK